ELLAEGAADPRRQRLAGRQPQQLAPVGDQREVDVEPREREPRDQLLDLRALGARRAQEAPPRRRVEEQVAHLDDGARRAAAGPQGSDRTALATDLVTGLAVPGPRADRRPADRADRRERLAAEAEARDVVEVAQLGQLARRMADEGELEVLRLEARAVVGDPDRLAAAVLDLDDDARRTGVQAVLDELLDDRERPLDHLAGGDLVDDLRRQHPDHAPPSAK